MRLGTPVCVEHRSSEIFARKCLKNPVDIAAVSEKSGIDSHALLQILTQQGRPDVPTVTLTTYWLRDAADYPLFESSDVEKWLETENCAELRARFPLKKRPEGASWTVSI
jgi:hypothetical protein